MVPAINLNDVRQVIVVGFVLNDQKWQYNVRVRRKPNLVPKKKFKPIDD